MKGADIMVAQRDASGSWSAKDYYSVDYVMPQLDQQQDVTLVSAEVKGNTTTVVFERPLDACDASDWSIDPTVPQYVIWAFGDAWGYHGTQNRGDSILDLRPKPVTVAVKSAAAAVADPNMKTIDINMTMLDIPTAETSYLCMKFKLPDDRKYHVTRYDALVNNSLVHHMIAHACTRPQEDLGTTFSCLSMPPDCAIYYFLWAPGQDTFEVPAEAAFPIGKGGVTWVALQVGAWARACHSGRAGL